MTEMKSLEKLERARTGNEKQQKDQNEHRGLKTKPGKRNQNEQQRAKKLQMETRLNAALHQSHVPQGFCVAKFAAPRW